VGREVNQDLMQLVNIVEQHNLTFTNHIVSKKQEIWKNVVVNKGCSECRGNLQNLDRGVK
jgi:hypothetical protein